MIPSPAALAAGDPVIEFDMDSAPAMDLSVAAADGLDHDVVHDARGIAKKSRPVGQRHYRRIRRIEYKTREPTQWYRAERRDRNEAGTGQFCGAWDKQRMRARLVMRVHAVSLDLTVRDCT